MDRRGFLIGAAAMPAVLKTAGASTLSIGDVARANGFRFGSAIAASKLDLVSLSDLIVRECDLVTPENALKLSEMQPNRLEDEPDFAKAIAIRDWLDEQNRQRTSPIQLRLHPLIFVARWDDPSKREKSRLPGWLEKIAETDKTRAVDALIVHCQNLLAWAPDLVTSIDVLNEAVEPRVEGRDGLYSHWFFTQGGFEAIAEVYAIAREAAPGVELVYNEWVLPYDTDFHEERRHAVLHFLEECRRRDISINTVGLQSHLTHTAGRGGYQRIWRSFLGEIEDMGYRIAITELDATDERLSDLSETDRDLEIARAVKDYLDVTLDVASLTDIVCWGLSDIHTYHNDGRQARPLPYDIQFQPKPMTEAIIASIKAAPERTQ